MRALTLLACQVTIPETLDASARDAHVSRLCDRITTEAAPGQYDLIVLPELSTIEYSDAAFTRLDTLAECEDGPSFSAFSALAQRLQSTVVYGYARQGDDGFYITQAAIGPDGKLLGAYDKLHLAQFGASAEAAAFTPGRHLFTFSVKGVKIAPMICYDIRFADLARRLADEGVGLILQCSAYAKDLSYHSWRHFVVTRAMENGIAWLGLNRAGKDWGGSIWCPGHADSEAPELVFGDGQEFQPLTLPAGDAQKDRGQLPILHDRRGDYETLPLKITGDVSQ